MKRNDKHYAVVMLNDAFEQVEVAIVKGFDDAFKNGSILHECEGKRIPGFLPESGQLRMMGVGYETGSD
ncbi:hypothetical protein C4A44_04147 [Escherichia coli]|uniref:hypothetical protein n=1 Tax=Escherichia coli TaxID=562 RepID=UPI000E2D1629|nr:hypothetical protein [Escherichia coli]RDP88970.1 hypothetical protein C4A44_04147 [Escherichia coli]